MPYKAFESLRQLVLSRPKRRRNSCRSGSVEILEIRSLLSGVAGSPDFTLGGDGMQGVLPDGYEVNSGRVAIAVNAASQVFGIAEYALENTNIGGEFVFARTVTGAPLTTFGNDGFVNLSEVGFDYNAGAIAVQADGKIVVGGDNGFRYGGALYRGDFAFTRLNPDGTRDNTFGDNGITVIDAGLNDHSLNSIVILPDGQILASGAARVASGSPQAGIDLIALIKLTTNGDLSAGFGDSGQGYSLAGFETIPEAVLFDSVYNRIIVVGEQQLPGFSDDDRDISIHQFFADGLEDNNFGGGDAVVTIGRVGWYDAAQSATLSGGWIYVAGFGYTLGGSFQSRDYVARVSRGPGLSDFSTGVWDDQFDVDGYLEVDQLTLGILDAPQGGFYLSGGSVDVVAGQPNSQLELARYTQSGVLDPTFGQNGSGKIPTDGFGGSESELIRDSQGGLLFAGADSQVGNSEYTVQVVRFLEKDRVDKPVLSGPVAFSNDLTPTITWNADPFVDHYILQVNNISTGQARVIYAENVESASFTPADNLAPGRYRAWVRGVSANGVLSPWSSLRNFEVQPIPPVISTPAGPVAEDQPRIDWNDVSGATSYSVFIALASAPSVPIVTVGNLTTSEFTPATPLHLGNYVVKVRASNTTGLLTAWSSSSAFRIKLETPAGLTRSLVPGTANSRLRWNPVFDAVSYDLWVDRIDVPQTQVIRQQTLTNPLFTSSLTSGTYRMFVRAKAASGELSAWSAPKEFAVALTAPQVISPALTYDQTPVIRWGDDTTAVSWEIKVNSTTTSSVVIPPTATTGKLFTVSSNLPYGVYSVWVRGVLASGAKSVWSPRHEMLVTLRAPSLTGPTGIQGNTPLITWSAVGGASVYDLRVDNRTTGQTQVIRQTAVSGTQFQVISPLTAGTYRIWIRAISSVSTGRFAGLWSSPIDIVIA